MEGMVEDVTGIWCEESEGCRKGRERFERKTSQVLV